MSNTQQVLNALRANVENVDGEWGSVYLDNARPDGMNDKQFRAALAQLSKAGLYRVVDGYAFGDVKMAVD